METSAPVYLTVKRRDGFTFPKAKVFTVNPKNIKFDAPSRTSSPWYGFTRVVETVGAKMTEYLCFESPEEITAQILMNEGQATGLLAKNFVDLSVDAAGATQGAAAAIVKTYTEIDTATATTTDGVRLFAATKGKVAVIINTVAAVPLDVWPATGENHDGLADNALLVQPARSRVHYVCETATTWYVAEDATRQ